LSSKSRLDEPAVPGHHHLVKYDRTVLAYHGCDASVARTLLAGGSFKPSQNDYDWLGEGVYFWEFGYDRALQFAKNHKARGKIKKPTVVVAILQLGNCFDLMDTKFTDELPEAYKMLKRVHEAKGEKLPENSGPTNDNKWRRKLDCAVLNLYLKGLKDAGVTYDSVRCGFVEGRPAFEGSGIQRQSHVQIAVRTPSCIVGVFSPR